MSHPAAGRWIIGRNADLAFIIFPAVTGYACLYANVTLGVSSFLIWWFWNVAANGPHLFATLSRTYLDKQEWHERAPLLVGSLALVLVGPAALWASVRSGSTAPFLAFWVVQVLWAYYHVVRQHYGFLALYQRVHGEPVGADNRADYWIFNLFMFGPVLAWFLRYPEFREAVGLAPRLSTVEAAVLQATLALVLTCGGWYVIKETRAFARTGAVNLPKSLLLVSYVPLHLVLLLRPTIAGGYDILLFNAVVTLPHDVQYLAIVWFHNRNRYHAPRARQTFGWAATVSASLPRLLACAVAFGLVFYYGEWFLEGRAVPFAPGRYAGAGARIGGPFRVADLVGAIWIGLIFHHYYLDQKIWRIRADQRLTRDLRLDPAVAAAASTLSPSETTGSLEQRSRAAKG